MIFLRYVLKNLGSAHEANSFRNLLLKFWGCSGDLFVGGVMIQRGCFRRSQESLVRWGFWNWFDSVEVL